MLPLHHAPRHKRLHIITSYYAHVNSRVKENLVIFIYAFVFRFKVHIMFKLFRGMICYSDNELCSIFDKE